MSSESSLRIPLPHSKMKPYTGNFWPILQKDLEKLKTNPSTNLLEMIILKHLNRNLGSRQTLQSLPNLRHVLSQQPTAAALISLLAELALKLPDLFPEGSMPGLARGERRRVRVSRAQAASLLAHMLLCSVLVHDQLRGRYCGHFTGAKAPTGPQTFFYWLYIQENSTNIYLRTLLTYFGHTQTLTPEQLEEEISFERFVCGQEEKSWDPTSEASRSKTITDIRLHLDGRIGDLEQVEVDFANKHVGFGTTATQEELLLGTSPETCIVVLFNEILEPNESLLMTGARRFGDYSGYGRTAQYTGVFSPDWDWTQRKIIAIDAISHPDNQLGDVTMMRELRKAWLGFSSVRGERISTGHWGCGAFGGDQNVKCLVQVLAASLAGVSLDFYCFQDKQFYDAFQAALKAIQGKSVGWLWDTILEYREAKVKRRSVLDHISNKSVVTIVE